MEPSESVVSKDEKVGKEVVDEDEKILNSVDQIESLCMRCGENGITTMLMHKIPYFRELIIASFRCEECGENNNEVTFGGEIQLQGCLYELKLTNPRDLDRQLIKSDSASIRIPSIDFEIPASTQKGEISTIEGFLRVAATNLGMYQEERMQQTPEIGIKVAEIIVTLQRMAAGELLPFEIILDDPAGNSFIQNPIAPQKDIHMKLGYYYRTPEQDISLGLNPEKGIYRDDKDSNFKALLTGKKFGDLPPSPPPTTTTITTEEHSTTTTPTDSVRASTSVTKEIQTKDTERYQQVNELPHKDDSNYKNHVDENEERVKLGRSEIVSIPSPCPSCGKFGESLTALTDIPHFKEVIIMAFDCLECGYKDSEIRGGGAVPTMGTRVKLTATNMDDLKRDVLKSDSSNVLIPELELELSHGTLGGLFTTVEGLLNKIKTSLTDNNPFAVGDSTTLHHSSTGEPSETRKKFSAFMAALDDCIQGKKFPFTLILSDPLGNSFISAPLGSYISPEEDEHLEIEDFLRSHEENEEFGLNDINTRDYETGVTYDDVILPDRLTHYTRKVIDHPTFFAKGTDDATPGGAYIHASSSTHTHGNTCDTSIYPHHTLETITETVVESGTNSAAISVKEGTVVMIDGVMSTTTTAAEVWYSNETLPLGWKALKPGEKEPTIDTTTTTTEVSNNEGDLGVGEEQAVNIVPSFMSTTKESTNTNDKDDDDKDLQFEPCAQFSGPKIGFLFRMGTKGLGYYEDKKPMSAATS